MSTRSPKERLQRLFRKSDASTRSEDSMSASPPSSPPSSGNKVRNRKSSSSFRDVLHGRARPEPTAPAAPAAPVAPSYRKSVETPSPAARVAASKAYNVDHVLPGVPHESDLSSDLRHLTLAGSSTSSEVGRSTDERNERRIPRKNVEERRTIPQQPGGSRAGNVDQAAALVPTTSAERHPLARKQNNVNLRNSQDDDDSQFAQQSSKRSIGQQESGNTTQGRDVGRPLPNVPTAESSAQPVSDQLDAQRGTAEVESELGKERGYLVKDADRPVDLSGIVDLSSTVDTTLHERWAPAVVHETIVRNVHEIREERITREIHNHHVFHRVLPIIDIEVLPARHFVPVEGGYAEISEDEVPGQAGKNAHWLIAETVSKSLPKSSGPLIPQHFTARKFEGTQGDYKEYMTPEGFKRTETWWVHPPTLEEGGITSGQTYPFYFNSPDPKDDGLRATLPVGSIIGVSPLLAKQQRERMAAESSSSSTRPQVKSNASARFPDHKVFV